jgi:hypothetical protein
MGTGTSTDLFVQYESGGSTGFQPVISLGGAKTSMLESGGARAESPCSFYLAGSTSNLAGNAEILPDQFFAFDSDFAWY